MPKLKININFFLSIVDVSAIKDMMAKTAKEDIIHVIPHPVKTGANAQELDYTILHAHVRKVSHFLHCYNLFYNLAEFFSKFFWQQEMCIFTN